MTCMALLVESHRSGCAARMCLGPLPILPTQGWRLLLLHLQPIAHTKCLLQDQPTAKVVIMLR